MPIKHIKKQVDNAWTWTKRIFVALCIWGVVFSLATVAHLRVAYEYDGALVDSAASFRQAEAAAPQAFAPSFWAAVNQSYYLDRPKIIPYATAWILKLFGFGVDVYVLRPSTDGEALREDWRHLVSPRDFIFLSGPAELARALENSHYLLFFGSSDGAVEAAKDAHVFPLRVLRKPQDGGRAADYNPGMFRELRIPYSQY